MAVTPQIQNNTKNHWIHEYTGTPEQPDVVSIFWKSGEKKSTIKIAHEQITNEFGHSPFAFPSAFPRIKKATEIMFQEIKQGTCFNPESEFWNAFKNGVRGIVQLVPLLGNAILWAYDGLRTTCSIHPKIKTAIAEQQNVLGVAFDGKPVFTVPISELGPAYSDVELAQFAWYGLLERCFQEGAKPTRLELVEDFKKMLTEKNTHPYPWESS